MKTLGYTLGRGHQIHQQPNGDVGRKRRHGSQAELVSQAGGDFGGKSHSQQSRGKRDECMSFDDQGKGSDHRRQHCHPWDHLQVVPPCQRQSQYNERDQHDCRRRRATEPGSEPWTPTAEAKGSAQR